MGVVQVLLDQVINIGAKLWDIIKQNAPVVNVSTSYAVAVPQWAQGDPAGLNWTQLQADLAALRG